jgi:hypothetical protein
MGISVLDLQAKELQVIVIPENRFPGQLAAG